MDWSKTTLILCIFGFLKEFRPSEPFVTDYLTGPWKNFTDEQVNQEMYPIGTYCYFGSLIIVLLLVDIIRYKPAIVISGVSGILTYIMILYGTTIFEMQIVQFLYALLMSTEVAYFTYIYSKVDKQYYQKVTSYTRTAFLLGRFTAGSVAQITTSFGVLNYQQLNYLTLSSFVIATIWALFLPSVKQSIYFHREDSNDLTIASGSLENHESNKTFSSSSRKLSNGSTSFYKKIKIAYGLLWQDFLKAYTDTHVMKWSFWWAFATCGYLQVINYTQLLWRTAAEDLSDIYNGAVEAIYTIISAIAVFIISMLHLNWPLVGEAALSIFSIAEGLLLLTLHISYNIWVLYSSYIAFGVLYHSMITVASFEVAKHISEDSYGLIFGINTFMALLFQSLLTFVVVSKSCFALGIRSQFLVYGGYFLVLGIIFMIMSGFTLIYYHKKKKPMKIWLKDTDSLYHSKDNIGSELNLNSGGS